MALFLKGLHGVNGCSALRRRRCKTSSSTYSQALRLQFSYLFTNLSRVVPAKSHFYEQVTAVKRFLISVFPSLVLLPLLSFVKVVPRCCLSTVFLFAL